MSDQIPSEHPHPIPDDDGDYPPQRRANGRDLSGYDLIRGSTPTLVTKREPTSRRRWRVAAAVLASVGVLVARWWFPGVSTTVSEGTPDVAAARPIAAAPSMPPEPGGGGEAQPEKERRDPEDLDELPRPGPPVLMPTLSGVSLEGVSVN